MPANPIACQQIMVLGTHLVVGGTVVWHLWAVHKRLQDNLLAPFRFRWLGYGALVAAGLSIALLILTMMRWAELHHGYGMTLVSVPSALLLAFLGLEALRRYPGDTERALKAARQASSFERSAVFRAYAQAFPGAIEPMLTRLHEPATLRALAEMDREGYSVDGRRLAEIVAERLANAGPEALHTALDLGLFDHDPNLRRRAEQRLREARMHRWEAILERAPGAPQVGHMMRAVIEEALTHQNPRLTLRFAEGVEPGSSVGRLAFHALGHALRETFDSVGLELDLPDKLNGAPLPFEVTLRLEAFTSQSYRREEVRRKEYGTIIHGHGRGISHHREEVLTVGHLSPTQVTYPMMRVSCTLTRHGRVEGRAEADSSPGAQSLGHHRVPSQDMLTRRAVNLTLEGLVRGLGLNTAPRKDHEEHAQPALASVFAASHR